MKMMNNHDDEANARMIKKLDEIQVDVTIIKAQLSQLNKTVLGNGQLPVESRLTRLETEIDQIQSQSAKSWQFFVAIGAAISSIILSFILKVLA